jgi:UDP-glucose 4-epimerase
MKLLILGGTGFIGKNLKEAFSEKTNYSVLAPTRQELNLYNDQDCRDYLKVKKPDFVIHAAVDITSAENSLVSFFNIYNSSNFFGHLLQIGSGAEYDRRHYKPKMNESYFGKSVPVDTYGLAKFMIASVLEDSDPRKFKNLRVFGIYGKYEDYSRRFISNNICRALSGMKISMNKDMLFDFISVNDLSNLLINHFDNLYIFDKVSYNFCSKEPKYLSDIARILCDKLNQNDFAIKDASELNPEYSGDPSEILSLLPDFNYIDLEQSISELINYYQLLFNDKLVKSEFALNEQEK